MFSSLDTCTFSICNVNSIDFISNDVFKLISQTLDTDYIWQKDVFSLENATSHIYGELHYGDNIDDEWHLVSMLQQLSSKIQYLAIQVQDTDGEILLIEGSDFLSDSNCEESMNRCWIFNGLIHLIPSIPTNPSQIGRLTCGDLEMKTALILLSIGIVEPLCREFQDCITTRSKQRPLQKMVCLIPRKIAQILTHDHRLIARCVNAFYYRTPDTMKSCLKNETFPLDDLVKFRVVFTRCLYAQIKCQEMSFPKLFPRLPAKYDPNYESLLMGYKITAGFQMDFIVNQSKYEFMEKLAPFKENTGLYSDSDDWLGKYQDATDLMDEKLTREELFGKMKSFLQTESGYDGVDPRDFSKMENDQFGEFDEMKSYISQMDKELNEEGFDDIDVDEVEMMKNLYESYMSEGGMGGPISSLFQK